MKLKSVGSTVIITHGNQEIPWNVKVLERSKRSRSATNVVPEQTLEDVVEEADPFYQVNQYLDYLPPEKQDQLFDVYLQINHVFEYDIEVVDVGDLMQRISPLLKTMFEICPASNVSYWVRSISSIVIPKDIRVFETLDESISAEGDLYGIRNRPVESTYLRPDYWSLIVLIMMLRLVMPVWGRFMTATVGTVGNDLKELYALRLVGRTALVEADGYKRLEQYVQLHMSEEKIKNSVIGGKVSKEDFPFYMLSLVVVRRLAWVDFSGINSTFSLVAWVYLFIDQVMNSTDRALNDAIRPKIPENGASHGDHENRSSVFELVKVKEPLSAGRIGMMQNPTRKPYIMAERLCPDMPTEILDTMLEVVSKLQRRAQHQGQVMLLQLVMGVEVPSKFDDEWGPLFPSRGVDELNLLEMLNLVAVGAAFFWHRGFYEFAALLTASPASENSGAVMAISAAPQALTKENKDLLAQYWPHSPRPSGKKRNEGARVQPGPNVAIENIEIIREHLSQNSWILNLPLKGYLDKIPNHNGSRRYAVKSDIRNRLADFSIRLVTRSI